MIMQTSIVCQMLFNYRNFINKILEKILDDVVMKIDEGEGQYKQLKAWADVCFSCWMNAFMINMCFSL